MTEDEYIHVENVTYINIALHALKNINPYASSITTREYQQAMEYLYIWQDKILQKKIVITPEDKDENE